jgi:hypothetical protein
MSNVITSQGNAELCLYEAFDTLQSNEPTDENKRRAHDLLDESVTNHISYNSPLITLDYVPLIAKVDYACIVADCSNKCTIMWTRQVEETISHKLGMSPFDCSVLVIKYARDSDW